MTERIPGLPSPGIPSPEQVTALLGACFAQAGYEIEDVAVDTRARPPRLRIVADGDTPLDLDTIAELSRTASAQLDTLDDGAGAYLLEVTSPGVDRPLTAEKHFRRARGRKAEIALTDGAVVTGRLGVVSDGAVDVVVRDRSGWAVRRIPLADIGSAVVQVEFSPPSARERELADTADTTDRDVNPI